MRQSHVISSPPNGHLEEEIDYNGTSTLILAPHGGAIEPYTENQVERVLTHISDTTGWIVRGYHNNGAYPEWHEPSDTISATRYRLLNQFTPDTFNTAISFHGMQYDGIIIGGDAAKPLKNTLAHHLDTRLSSEHTERKRIPPTEHLTREILTQQTIAPTQQIPIYISDGPNDIFNGHGAANITNRFARDNRGIQIEQSLSVRQNHGAEIATIVATFAKNQTEPSDS